MLRFRLCTAILLLAAPASGQDGAPRIADIRVGQHGAYERIVVELESQTGVTVRWKTGPDGADVFEISARPLLARQVLASGRPRVGDLTLVAVGDGAQLTLPPLERRTRAFQLDQPPRLVIDVAEPGDEPFDAPSDVHALQRDAEIATAPTSSAEPGHAETPVGAEPMTAPPDPAVEIPAEAPVEPPTAADPVTAAAQELREAVEPPALAPVPVVAPVPEAPGRKSWLRSQALLVPLLAGAGVLLLAAGGLALASAQRRPRPADPPSFAHDPIDLTGTRLDVLEKRLDDEVRARSQLEEQVAQTRAEVGALRDLLARLRSQAAARAAAPSAPQ
jgi:hypothetical protein